MNGVRLRRCWLGLVLSFGCSSVPTRGPSTCGRQDDVAVLGRYLAAAKSIGEQWPGFRIDLQPVFLVGANCSFLLNAPPLLGFRPSEGSRCPCEMDAGIPLETDGIGLVGRVQETDGGVSLQSRWSRAQGVGQAGIVINDQASLQRVKGRFLVHECFHGYQEATSWYSRSPQPLGNLSAIGRQEASAEVREQLVLADALRRAPGHRLDALERWAMLRRAMVGRTLGRKIAYLETFEGTAFYFETQVLWRVAGRSRASLEAEWVRELERGGRGLDDETWFSHSRPYVTGGALCALLDDEGGTWRTRVPEVTLADLLLGMLPRARSAARADPLPEALAPDLASFRTPEALAPGGRVVRIETQDWGFSLGAAWAGPKQGWWMGSTERSWAGTTIGLSGEISWSDNELAVRVFGRRGDDVIERLVSGPVGPAGFESPILRLRGQRISVVRKGRDLEVVMGMQ